MSFTKEFDHNTPLTSEERKVLTTHYREQNKQHEAWMERKIKANQPGYLEGCCERIRQYELNEQLEALKEDYRTVLIPLKSQADQSRLLEELKGITTVESLQSWHLKNFPF